ncbi:hypothetical protein KOI35_10980 [Actinoplanes bogorensis]|uniref:Tetratricopeptide repeat protein n=1 Tax=Paractinoplanes bogorensis TaxID=1610840 RepID=A0ABS5YKV1_9ACTN|nr:hypothetical protein [Actinoplanes bogorensis]MBU2664013.1 hypothetical protein [Actinoplanes bogorensis]
MSNTASLALARVLAHCGGSPAEAVAYVAAAIEHDPADPEPYDLIAELRPDLGAPTGLAQFVAGSYLQFLDGDTDGAARMLGSVTGFRPEVAWAAAPWFTSDRFRSTVTIGGLADATVAITDYDRDLDNDVVRDNLRPWMRLIDIVCERDPVAEQMARMAILLRYCGRTEESFALCDRADGIEKLMLTEVVRAGTWGFLGRRDEQAAALRRALALDPANWSLYLDLADHAAMAGDFGSAADLVNQGLQHEPDDVTLRAAGATYRLRAGGPVDDVDLLLELAPDMPHAGYRNGLIEQALGTPGLPADRTEQLSTWLS